MHARALRKGELVPADLTKSNEFQGLTDQHLRVVSLRLDGKRWTEIAAALGVTPWTIWHWRQENPLIDQAIMEESADYLVASRIRMVKMIPLADNAIQQAFDAKKAAMEGALIDDHTARLTAAKMVKDTFKQLEVEALQRAPIPASGRLNDDELDRILDATAAG